MACGWSALPAGPALRMTDSPHGTLAVCAAARKRRACDSRSINPCRRLQGRISCDIVMIPGLLLWSATAMASEPPERRSTVPSAESLRRLTAAVTQHGAQFGGKFHADFEQNVATLLPHSQSAGAGMVAVLRDVPTRITLCAFPANATTNLGARQSPTFGGFAELVGEPNGRGAVVASVAVAKAQADG